MNRKKLFFLLPVLLLAFQQSAQAAHANYEDKDFPLSDCQQYSSSVQKADCFTDYAVSHHIFYWGNTVYGVNANGPIEEGFAAAYQASPDNINIANSYAASLVRNGHAPQGIDQYKANFTKFGDFQSGFTAWSLIRAAAKTADEHNNAAPKLYQQLKKRYPDQTRKYTSILNSADKLLQDESLINFDIPAVKTPGRYHAIVVLGFQLDKNGNPQEPLVGIMNKALAVANAYPTSKIIVTGGVPRNNRVEAEVMSDFFTSHGINKSRIIPEVLSYDTVQNANYVAMIMRSFNIREATIVTRAGHIRRGTALMQNATQLYVPWKVAINSVAWKDTKYKTEEDSKKAPKLGSGDYKVTYRDVLRIYQQEYPGFIN
ncbi:YdcF family protein [Salmonella enterica subsp. enterica serovar Enteritidis]|nr:YdcF family protein [Salmonella enterica subsp. enterica serovar Enteritidis]EFO7714843.1 YdcF family protein [Salmonella enterica]